MFLHLAFFSHFGFSGLWTKFVLVSCHVCFIFRGYVLKQQLTDLCKQKAELALPLPSTTHFKAPEILPHTPSRVCAELAEELPERGGGGGAPELLRRIISCADAEKHQRVTFESFARASSFGSELKDAALTVLTSTESTNHRLLLREASARSIRGDL